MLQDVVLQEVVLQAVLRIQIRSDQDLFPGSGIICSGSGSGKNYKIIIINNFHNCLFFMFNVNREWQLLIQIN